MLNWQTFEYDAHGELATEFGVVQADAEPRLIQQFVRDAAGNVLYSYGLQRDGESAHTMVRAFD